MLSVSEAQAELLKLAAKASARIGTERVSLATGAGRVLREPLVATTDWPKGNLSMMDGYAVRSSDFSGSGPWTFPVPFECPTGRPSPAHSEGTAPRIFTGAELPRGADAIIMQEDATRDEGRVTFHSAPAAFAFVRRQGDDVQSGATVLASGSRLGPRELAILAQNDRTDALVARRPRVALITTGSELRAPGSPDRPGSIPDCVPPLLTDLIERAGGVLTFVSHAADELGETARVIAEAQTSADVIVTVGGVSVGDHDLVKPAIEQLGASLEFWKVAMKPGKPLAMATLGNSTFFGLPGNPVSAFVTFFLFGAPFIRAITGASHPFERALVFPLGASYKHQPGRTEFARGVLRIDERGSEVIPIAKQASGSLVGLVESELLFEIPSDSAGLQAGDFVKTWLI